MKLINADMIVHWQSYDDEHETFPEHTGTIAEFLDAMTDEGCPEGVEAIPVVHGRWQYHINANNDVNPEDAYCSKCGFYVDVTTTFNFNKYLHCPNCGARMDGVKRWED